MHNKEGPQCYGLHPKKCYVLSKWQFCTACSSQVLALYEAVVQRKGMQVFSLEQSFTKLPVDFKSSAQCAQK